MKGTDKQIKYASDLIEKKQQEIKKFTDAGKADHPTVIKRSKVLAFCTECEDASLVIEILTNSIGLFDDENPVEGKRGIKAYYNL